MKILVAGRGPRIPEIAALLASRSRRVFAVTPDPIDPSKLTSNTVHIQRAPETVELVKEGVHLGSDDVAILIENQGDLARTMIVNLKRQLRTPDIAVLTEAYRLRAEFPELLFRPESAMYRQEFHYLLKRVRTRKKIESIRHLAQSAEQVVILIWGNPDPDAIASAFALQHLIGPDAKKVRLAYMGEFTRPENAAMVEFLRIPMQKFDRSMLTPATTVFTVDAQPSFFQLNGDVRFDVVIDHHPKAIQPNCRIKDVRTTYGSTSTILTEYYLHSRRKIPRLVATALFYGLKVDTNNLTRNVSENDIRAFRVLKKYADENLIRSIELSQMPIGVLDNFGVAIGSKKIADRTLFAYLGPLQNPDIAVYIADFFMRLSGISVVIVACRKDDRVFVIFRGDGFRNDVGKIAESTLSGYGTAGGHRTMARAEMELAALKAEVAHTDDASIERWILLKLSASLKPLRRLIQ